MKRTPQSYEERQLEHLDARATEVVRNLTNGNISDVKAALDDAPSKLGAAAIAARALAFMNQRDQDRLTALLVKWFEL